MIELVRVWMVRCAPVAQIAPTSTECRADRVLDALGHRLADRLAVRLGSRAIASLVASDRRRARAFAEPLSVRAGVPVSIDPSFAPWPAGTSEARATFQAEVAEAITRWAAAAGEREIVVCTHRSVIQAAITRMLDLAPSAHRTFEIDPGACVALDWALDDASGARPALAGTDLDWLPDPASRVRNRFPGATTPPSR